MKNRKLVISSCIVRYSVLIVLIIVLLAGGIIILFDNGEVEGWQTISLPQAGTMQIPPEWHCYEENDYVYIVDENDTLIMFQDFDTEEGDSEIAESYKFLKDIKYHDFVEDIGSGFSNGASYGKMLISCEGTEYEKYYIQIVDDKFIKLIVWTDSIDEETVAKIAKTYNMT